MSNCIFCKIIAGEIPCKKVFEDDHVLAFHDIHPKAPVHVLVVPKRHLPTLADATAADAELLGIMMDRIRVIAEEVGIAASGYRLVTNVREGGGQEVFHLHTHILGGKRLPF